MANFEPKKLDLDDINGGIRFTESDGVTPNAINDPIEAVAYSQTVVEHLTDTPDTSEINNTGSPNVSFISSTTADGVTIYKFKFSNLSGATFTPSLDEAGNLSWSNNRNLPNPPTINISGRDYLFSSEVLSGTYIPQVNSEVTDIPLTSFNRAPVDDIDHCYLFYYYTPENIYYWLATQVVDIQETTATLKILSVVRLTGYTPTIGENGNWVINGEDTGKPSYGASGVTDVVAGASYNQDDFTVTPLTFNFEVGNSKTVNVKAAIGDVGDGTYAKLAQVVRTDVLLPLDDEEFERFSSNIRRPYGETTYYYNGWIYAVKIRNLGPGRFIYNANFLVSDASVVLGLLQVKCLGSSVQGIDSDIKLKYIGFADKGVDFGAKNFKAVIDSDSNTTLNIYINSYSGIGVQLLSDFRTVDTLIEFPFEKTEEPEGGVFAEYFDIQANGVVIGAEFNGKDITEDCTMIRCSGSIIIADGVTVNAIDSPSITATGDGTLLRNGYAVGDFFIGTNSPAARAGGEWTQLAAGQTVVSSGTDYPLGATGGTDSVVLTIEQMPSHDHRVGTVQEGNAAYGYTQFQAARDGYKGSASATVDSTGGGQAHTNMPPYYVTNLWRRTA